MCGPHGKIHTGPVQRFFHLPEYIQCLLGSSGCPVTGRQTAQNGILGIFILIKNAGGAAIELNLPGIYPLHRANLHASIEGCARFRTQKAVIPAPGTGEISRSALPYTSGPIHRRPFFSAFWSNSACSANCPGSLPASVTNCRDAPSPPSGSDLTETPLFFPSCRS